MTANITEAQIPPPRLQETPQNFNKFSHLTRNPIPNDLSQENPFLFYVLNIEGETDKESSSPEEGNMRIRLYGVNQHQNTVLAYVDGFLCHIKVEYPSYLDDPSDEKLETIKLVLNEEFRIFSGKKEVTAISKVIFQGNTEQQQQNSRTGLLARYLTLYLTNPKHLLPFMNYFNALEENKDTKYPKPVLEEYQKYDYFNMQFLSDTGLRLLTWVQLEPNSFQIVQENEKKSTCQIEIKTTVEAFSLSLATKPDNLPKPFLRILSFDIECDYIPGESNNETKLRKAIQIANVFTLQENEPQFNKNIFTFDTCDKIDGADVYWYHKEADLLSDWRNFITTYDPDVITGYNINKFDFNFLLQRGRFLQIENFEDLSRQKEAHYLKDRKTFALNGRLVIDLFGFMQDMNPDLENMKLNTVAQVFLNEEKEDVSYNEISEDQNLGIEGRTKLAIYCIQDSNLVLRLFMKLQVLDEIAKKTCQPAPVLHRHALQRKMLPKTKRKKEESNKTSKEGKEGEDNTTTTTTPPPAVNSTPEIASSTKEVIEKFLLQRASNYLLLKGSTQGYEDYNQRLKDIGSHRLFIKLHDKNKTTFITGYLEGEAFEKLGPQLQTEQDLLIKNFQMEQVLFEVEHKVIKIFEASIIDMNQQGIKIYELMTRAVCLNPFYLIVNKDLATAFKKECQNVTTCFDSLVIPDIEEKPVVLSQPMEIEAPKKPKHKINDYFRTAKPTIERANTDPAVVSKKEEFLGKRSLSLLPEKELAEKHEPGIEKKIKNEISKKILEEEYLFSKLDLSNNAWKIKGRVIGKTKEIQIFHEGIFKPGFIIELIDESEHTISAVFLQKETVENYFNQLIIGNIYLISGGLIINKTFESHNESSLQLYFDNNYTPQIQPQQALDFPNKTYNFDSIPSIQKSLLDSHAYIIGIVIKVTFENLQRKDKLPQTVRKLIVSDQAQNQVEVMMWEEFKELTIKRLDLVCILQAKIKEFNKSKYLSLSSQSQVFVNFFPSQETFQQLYDWTCQIQKDRISYLLKWKSLQEDKSCTIQDLENWKEKNGNVEIRGYIGRGKNSNFTYESCKNCKRRIDPARQEKVTFLFGSPSDAICEESSKRAIKLEQVKQGLTDLLIKYSNHDSLKKCDYCSLSFIVTENTTVMNYALGDYTSVMNIKSFANMPNILGEEINAESELKEFKIKVKIATEFSKEKSYTIMGAQPIDFIEESLNILNLLEKYQ